MLSPALVTTWRDRAVLGVAGAVFLVPAGIMLLGPTPARYGFQMYSGHGLMSASWEDRDGTVHRVRLGEHIANARTEVDWTPFLPERLCSRIPEAVRVEVRRTRPGEDERRTVTC